MHRRPGDVAQERQRPRREIECLDRAAFLQMEIGEQPRQEGLARARTR